MKFPGNQAMTQTTTNKSSTKGGSTTPAVTTITSQNIKLFPIDQDLNGELAEKIHYECNFCGKTIGLYPLNRKICERLSGDQFYCPFCLRNRFNTRNNKHILILSFRSLVGYYYYEKYAYTHNREVWISEIMDFMESHAAAGLVNPLFSYDPESMLWFIDFSKVGKGRKKVKVAEVLKTILSILTCFNINQHVTNGKLSKFYLKYEEAILKFYQQRYRPEDRKHLIPTLANCGIYENKKYSLENTRLFTPAKIIG